jgi:hypothetical protein
MLHIKVTQLGEAFRAGLRLVISGCKDPDLAQQIAAAKTHTSFGIFPQSR